MNPDKDWESWAATSALKAVGINKYVSSNDGNACVQANKSSITPSEKFQVIDMGMSDSGNTKIALKANNNKYVSTRGLISYFLQADKAPLIEDGEVFEVIDLGNGIVALKASNGKYVTYSTSGNCLKASQSVIGKWEKFTLTPLH